MPRIRIAAFIAVLSLALTASLQSTAFASDAAKPSPTLGASTATAPAQTVSTAAATTTGVTPTAATTSNAKGSSASGESNNKAERGIAVGILALGVIGLLFAYLFYNGWRNSYQKLADAALRTTRRLPQTIFNPVESAQFRSRGLSQEAAAQHPVVQGPAAVVVGEPAKYKATVGDAPATSCAWAVEPADSATVKPASGAETTVTATKEGPITLTATVAGAEPTLVHITAIPKVAEGGVPLLGAGFGGLAAAVLAFTIAGALTALNILSGSAFIAFLGPVVGYFFAATRDSGGTGGSSRGSGGTGA